MKKILVVYWTRTIEEYVGIKHNSRYEYTREKRNEIIDLILDKGFNVMLYQQPENLIIWIDNKRFTQR